jgi:uncharacterized repeat protein (TIGR03837 family)
MHQQQRAPDQSITCDIFCRVVDNYGDIGVSWRLAQQMAREYGLDVRLWVDDLLCFRRLCPEVRAQLPEQRIRDVDIRQWPEEFPEVQPADLVIEMFACALPQRYLLSMVGAGTHSAASGDESEPNKTVWINLEYLSAEDWVAGCHGLPSPQPFLPLTRYFFFPGFTPQTGGLPLEHDLIARRDSFQHDPQAINAFWQTLDVPPRQPGEMRVSLFCYENPGIPELLQAWAAGENPVLCVLPEGRALPQVARFFGHSEIAAGQTHQAGNLQLRVVALLEQARYDQLLWACDCNFVRGEDSFVRAQWAARPFVWQIYPQQNQAHLQKLRAFIELYGKGLAAPAALALHAWWLSWNETDETAASASTGALSWKAFREHMPALEQYTKAWALQLAENNLALNLLDFYSKKLIK